MHEQTKSFVKGTLPGWATAVMLGILSLLGTSMLHEFADFKIKVQETVTEVSVMKEHNKAVDGAIQELRMGQKDVLTELRVINASLQKR